MTDGMQKILPIAAAAAYNLARDFLLCAQVAGGSAGPARPASNSQSRPPEQEIHPFRGLSDYLVCSVFLQIRGGTVYQSGGRRGRCGPSFNNSCIKHGGTIAPGWRRRG
jgi:hypothetical protein